MTELIVSADVLADLLGVSRRRVEQLVKEGVFGRTGPGRYDAAAAVPAYIRRLGGGPSLDAKRNRDAMLAAKLEAQLLENARRRGDVVARARAEKMGFEFARGLRDQILAFPVRYGLTIAAEVGADPTKLNRALVGKLTEMLDQHANELSLASAVDKDARSDSDAAISEFTE